MKTNKELILGSIGVVAAIGCLFGLRAKAQANIIDIENTEQFQTEEIETTKIVPEIYDLNIESNYIKEIKQHIESQPEKNPAKDPSQSCNASIGAGKNDTDGPGEFQPYPPEIFDYSE